MAVLNSPGCNPLNTPGKVLSVSQDMVAIVPIMSYLIACTSGERHEPRLTLLS